MKIKICLCTLLLSQSVPAALVDFNDIPVGTAVSSLNPYGAAVIGTRLWVTERDMGTTVLESFTRGAIGDYGSPFSSPSVVIEAGPADAPGFYRDFHWNIEIAVTFQVPISTFSLDAYSRTYSSGLYYTGVDAMGETFIGSAWIGGFNPEITHLDIVAPEGGYITGFHFSQHEDVGSIFLGMDNLDYTTVSQIASASVPETIGLPTFVFSICGVLFVHRRLKTARK